MTKKTIKTLDVYLSAVGKKFVIVIICIWPMIAMNEFIAEKLPTIKFFFIQKEKGHTDFLEILRGKPAFPTEMLDE